MIGARDPHNGQDAQDVQNQDNGFDAETRRSRRIATTEERLLLFGLIATATASRRLRRWTQISANQPMKTPSAFIRVIGG
jgi:hypothetical protein